MKNFYKEGMLLPVWLVFCLNKLKLISTHFASKVKEFVLENLNRSDIESYAKYLASLIYEYQLRLEYELEKDIPLVGEKQKRVDKKYICLLIENKLISSYVACFYSGIRRVFGSLSKSCLCISIGIFMLFGGLANHPASGQEILRVQDFTSLEVGQKVPRDFWTREHLFYVNGDTVRKNLSEYKGKLLIFDFWATWCKSCIEGFPKIDLLQKKFNHNVNFILVNCSKTKDTKEKIKTFVDRYTSSYEIAQPMLILDEYLQNLFPHVGIPHFVWVNHDDTFLASTHPNEVNLNSINNVLAGNTSAVHQKVDEHLFTISPFEIDTIGIISRSIFKNYVEGARADAGNITKLGNYNRFQFVNQYINSLCYMAYSDELNGMPFQCFIYDINLDINTKRLLLNSSQYDMFCFEFLTQASLDIDDVKFEVKNLLKHQFNLVLCKGSGIKDVYEVKVNDKINLHKSNGQVEERQLNRELGPLYYKNMSLHALILGLTGVISRPMVMDAVPNLSIDIYFPQPLDKMNEGEVLSLLAHYGIEFLPKRENVVYVEFKSNKHD